MNVCNCMFVAVHPYVSVHDPAWWWVKASNLGGLSGPVVQFHLAHVVVCVSVFNRLKGAILCVEYAFSYLNVRGPVGLHCE